MTADDSENGPPSEPLLRVESVGHRFGDLSVLDDIAFELEPGTVTALIGPNGSGKTTLLRIIAGLLSPTRGSINRPDQDRSVGYLPQHPDFRPAFTVEETLQFYGGLLDGNVDVTAVLEQVGLTGTRDRRVEALSGGMRRLLGLAQAVLGRPPLLLLDEPTGDLDPGMTEHIFGVVTGLAGPTTAVLLATHDLTGAALADDVLVLDRGAIIADGPPSTIVEQAGVDSLGAAFGELVQSEAEAVSVGREGP